MALEEIRNERIKKLEKFKAKNLDPYPAKANRSLAIGAALKKFSAKKKFALAGRIMARREHGGSSFFDLMDETGKIQIYFKKDILKEEYDFALGVIDIGDFISVEGKPFKTKRGEPTIEVAKWTMLAKSLRPLPEKWHGLQDVEERFRKRYLDILMNAEVRRKFEVRTKIIRELRRLHEENGFLEVETPMLHSIPGGALARPFKTHHNALDIDLYLRIAPELYLKRLLVGGFERVYEIGKNFRNEGIDMTHNPEFTELECYAAYWDEEAMMKFVETIFSTLAKKFGLPPARAGLPAQAGGAQAGKKGEIQHDGKTIKFKPPFARVTFKDLLSRYAQINDYDRQTPEALRTRALQLGIEIPEHEAKGKVADEIYKKVCRPHIIQPTFVINHPVDISPLAKKSERAGEVRRFQLIAGGSEVTNAFAEINDPLDQLERFREQEGRWGSGDEEAHRIDEEYVEALEYGMPPAAGLGIGIDRLVMLFTDTKNIREVVLFPTMRPR